MRTSLRALFQWKLAIAAQLIWLMLVLAMGAWWTRLALKQADQIRSLEEQLGAMTALASSSTIVMRWEAVHRMIFWESLTFLTIVIILSLILFWFYWRETLRTRSLQAFFASMTHELRTPLASIRLQAECMPMTDSVRRLLEDTLRLETQLERSFELARVEGGGRIYLEARDLASETRKTVEPWKDYFAGRLIVVDEMQPGVLAFLDTAAFSVILRNFIENSVRHGGRHLDAGKVTVTFSNHLDANGDAILVIEDNGKPDTDIAKEKLGQLFQKGKHSGGTGVGLYLVRMLMHRMGGEVVFLLPPASSGFRAVLRFKGAGESSPGENLQ